MSLLKRISKLLLLILISILFNEAKCNDKFQASDNIDNIELNNIKNAVIFGITGQDGAYLSKFLVEKGYKVYGVVRRSSSDNTQRLQHIFKNINSNLKKNLELRYGDITDQASVFKIIEAVKPNEVYNLAAQSHVWVSFEKPNYTAQVDAIGTLNILEAIRNAKLSQKTKFYQASTSELYGLVQEVPQTETTPFYPRSPYGVAKLYAYWIGINYREAYNMFVCNGILFNHESPYRGENFVTRIISLGVASIKLGLEEKITIGNLNAKRDWGFAGDYVEAMWLMLQQNKPEDFVIATGETHSVREFMELAFKEVGIEIVWKGEGINEIGIDKNTNKILVEVNPKYFRPAEVDLLIGNPVKAEKKLGWKRKISFENLVKIMVNSDIELLNNKRCANSKILK